MADKIRKHIKGAVLFDLDNTLFDHEKTQAWAIKTMCENLHIDFQAFYPLFVLYNKEVWREFADRLITVSSMRIGRFRKTLNALHISHLDPEILSEEYLALYRKSVYLIEGTREVLLELKPHFILGIITNGTSDVQKKKIERSSLDHLFDFIVTVDEAGCSKPSPAFFELAFQKAGVPPKDITCVGDNFLEDIVGAAQAGAGRTVWFNPRNDPVPEQYHIRPDHIISRLQDLPRILLMK